MSFLYYCLSVFATTPEPYASRELIAQITFGVTKFLLFLSSTITFHGVEQILLYN
jgi:hypothetical protein